MTPAPVAPAAPAIGTATAGDRQATVSWSAPASNGGSAVTGYTVKVIDAANAQVGELRNAGATATSMVVTDLALLDFEPTMGAEDFSYFLLEKPGCYFLIGNGDGTHREGGHGLGPCMLHNPSYDFNDELIPLGASLWVRLAEAWLAAPG